MPRLSICGHSPSPCTRHGSSRVVLRCEVLGWRETQGGSGTRTAGLQVWRLQRARCSAVCDANVKYKFGASLCLPAQAAAPAWRQEPIASQVLRLSNSWCSRRSASTWSVCRGPAALHPVTRGSVLGRYWLCIAQCALASSGLEDSGDLLKRTKEREETP